jgi:hypothetical protein
MRWSTQKSLAAAGSVALVGLIVLLIARAPDPPPRVVPSPPVAHTEPKIEPVRHVEPAHAEVKAPPREPARVSSPPPVTQPTTPRPQNVFSSPGATSSAAPKKRPLESAIDTRR